MNKKLFGLIVIGLLFTGCVPKKTALSIDNANKIESSQVILVVPQEELEAEVEQSNMTAAAGGGLLFALIDTAIETSRSNSAEEFISPLRSYLSDIDVRKKLTDDLSHGLLENSWLHVSNIKVIPSLSETEKKSLLKESSDNAVLIINAAYKLEPSYKYLKTSATTEILLKNGKNYPKQIYKNSFLKQSESIAEKSDEAVAQAWTENEGARLRSSLTSGLEQLIADVIADLKPETSKAL